MLRASRILPYLFLILFSNLFASDLVKQESILLVPGTSIYQLSTGNIISLSEIVRGDSTHYVRDRDYYIDYRQGVLTLTKTLPESRLIISYLIIPPNLSKNRRIYERMVLSDTLKTLPRSPSADWFSGSGDLAISGSKTFSLNFSESGETDLLQSLYVNLSGELAKGVTIEAQLSDSQSKLSPEGDSKELSSLDQVFIRIMGNKWEIGMGDLELSYKNSRYLNFYTKLEGVSASYKSQNELSAAFSAGSGKSATMNIQIIDGKQGPYYLSPNTTQRSFIVVAGTEAIYVDGEQWERGADYFIDYSEGSVMFRRMIGSTNNVFASFQYSDENYRQSNLYSNSSIKLSERLSLRHHMIHQVDSKDNPLLFSFSEADLDSLANAGDNTVFTDGVSITEAGMGSYKLVTDPDGINFYEYAAGDSSAVYNIVFSYVGPGNGDYEQYSIGRYSYAGINAGAWHPVKIIIAPAQRTNAELSVSYEGDFFQAGLDALYSYQDNNTFSQLEDNDNNAGILSAWLAYSTEANPLKVRLDASRRFKDTYRFGSDGAPEQDFTALADPDSLAMNNLDLKVSYQSSFFRPELLLRYRELDDLYTQKALRFTSENQSRAWIPEMRLSSTTALQDGVQNSLLMYHNGNMSWQYRNLRLRLAGLYSSLEEDLPQEFGTRLIRWQPGVDFTRENTFTAAVYTDDTNSVKHHKWQTISTGQTYSIRHGSNFPNHRIDFDFSHRVLRNPNNETQPKTNYELFYFRSGHNTLSEALNMYVTYQLNQTEFFPRIRDLVWVGAAQGIYDSTGVMVDGGEFIYEYITSPTGSLSTELSGSLSLYLKPGNYLKHPVWQKITTDVSVNANEQLDQSEKWQTYLFLPEHSFTASSIFARRTYLQNIWLDLYKSRILSNLVLEFNRSLDQRYQSSDRISDAKQSLSLDFRNFYELNTRISIAHETQKESRYNSDLEIWRGTVLNEKVMNPQSTLQMETGLSSETGKQQGADNSYQLRSISLAPSIRSVFMQKYRVSFRTSLGYNFRAGDTYLLFLPQKREGFLADANVSAIYRINDFSTVSLEYRLSKYPDDKSAHNLKMEFKAEL